MAGKDGKNVGLPRIDPNLIPEPVKDRLVRETLNAIRRTQKNDPELWARICKRAEEIKREEELKKAQEANSEK